MKGVLLRQNMHGGKKVPLGTEVLKVPSEVSSSA